jgi:hypothetical protein
MRLLLGFVVITGSFVLSEAMVVSDIVLESETLYARGTTIYTSLGPVFNVRAAREEGGSGRINYVGDTVYGRATASVVNDHCLFIDNSTHVTGFCKGKRTPSIPTVPSMGTVVGAATAVPQNASSCGTAVFYTQRFLSLMGTTASVHRYISTIFIGAAKIYQKTDFQGVKGYGVHYIEINDTATALEWLSDGDISAQMGLLNARELATGTCAVLLIDADVYSSGHVGAAYVGGACIQGSNSAIVSMPEPSLGILVWAHELGHLFNAIHTEQYPSSDNCAHGVMDATLSSFYNTFSECSIRTIAPVLQSLSWCLSSSPPHTSSPNLLVIIIPSVVGGVVLLGVILVTWYRYRVAVTEKRGINA